MIKNIKSVLWRAAKRLSYIEDVRCLKVKIAILLVSYPETLLDVVHFGPGDLSPILSKTSQRTLVARVNVRVVAHIGVFTQRTQIGVPRLCKQQEMG